MGKGFFNWVKADGSTDFPAEPDRYHLYVALICPFACRALALRKLKGLEKVISVSVLDSVKKPGQTWTFNPDKPGCDADEVNGLPGLKEICLKADPEFDGTVSVPLLWDKKKGTAVNNESIDIMRMFNSEFNAFCPTKEQRDLDILPDSLKDKIEDVNSWVKFIIYGVYKGAFATTQEAYEKEVELLFQNLDKAEETLSRHRYLVGNQLTEADIRLFQTLVRFDVAYNSLFKCSKKRIVDYPNLQAYMCDIYQTSGISETVNIEDIKTGYWIGVSSLNPSGVVPIGPCVDFNAKHNRADMIDRPQA